LFLYLWIIAVVFSLTLWLLAEEIIHKWRYFNGINQVNSDLFEPVYLVKRSFDAWFPPNDKISGHAPTENT